MDANGYGYGDGKWKRVDELLNYKNNEHEQIVFQLTIVQSKLCPLIFGFKASEFNCN